MILLFVWSLLTTPTDRLVCSMWLSAPPTQASLTAAGCVWSPEQAESYVLRVTDLYSGAVICEQPAADLPDLGCDARPIDHYLLRVYEPGYQYQLCTVLVTHDGPPTSAEIAARPICPRPMPAYTASLVSSGPATAAPPAPPPCQLPALTPSDLTGLDTYNDYQILDTKLRWYYGSSRAWYDDLENFQNRYDPAIYAAGMEYSVPPAVIKKMIAKESQFWPLWDDPERDEVGLGQLTDDGADTALRSAPGLYAEFCPQAIDPVRCSQRGYDTLKADEQQMIRDVFRNSLRNYGTPRQAADHAAAHMDAWAQVLKSFYCAAGEYAWRSGSKPSWTMALAAYHAGLECVASGTICPAGLEYLQ